MIQTVKSLSALASRSIQIARPAISMALLCLTISGISPLTVMSQTDNKAPSDDLFLFPPNTPSRQVRGAILAERLNRTDLARRYMRQLIDAQLPAEELLRLRREFGIGQFLKLSSIRELQPTSQELLRIINEATKQTAPSAATVEALISELGQSEEQTLSASLKILSAEEVAVSPLLAADISSPQGEIASLLLKKYARRFRYGLLNELPNAGGTQQVRILGLLSTTHDRQLAMDLQRFRFVDSASVAAAATAACQRLSGIAQPDTANDTAATLAKKSLSLIAFAATPFPSSGDRRESARQRRPPGAEEENFGTDSLTRAVELARWAAELTPDDSAANALQLVAEVAEQGWPTKWPSEIAVPSIADDLPPATEVDTTAMRMAIASNNSAAILGMLGKTEAAAAVLRENADLLRKCSFQTDPRVRLLAATLRHQIGGKSSYADQVLLNAVDGSKKPEAVVIDSRGGDSRGTTEVLNSAGYATIATGSGQAGFEAATQQMGCELIVVHSNCLRWPLSMTVTNLRSDYRTRNTPIVIYGPHRDRGATDVLRHQFSGIWFLDEPISELTFTDAARISGIPEPLLTEEERSQMINFARTLTATD